MRYELVPLRTCVQAALDFRNANRPFARDLSYYTWRYLARPCSTEPLIAWAWSDGGYPVAAVTIAPHDFSVAGAPQHVGIVGDISVSSDQRGSGIGRGILEFVVKSTRERKLPCIVLPNLPAQMALARAGWHPLRRMQRYIRILSATGGISRKALANGLRIVDTIGSRVSPRALLRHEDISPDIDQLWPSLGRHDLAISFRTHAYLRWRYAQHPLERYHFLALREGTSLEGYAIVHRESGSLIVDDYLVTSKRCGFALCSGLIEHARAHRCDDIQLRFADTSCGVPWRTLGFIPRRDSIHVMTSTDAFAALPLRWFLTIGDKDI